MCGLNYKAFTQKWLMLGECTSFSFLVFFFFYCLIASQSHSPYFLRSQYILFFSVPKAMSVLLCCAFFVFSERFSWWNKTPFSHLSVCSSSQSPKVHLYRLRQHKSSSFLWKTITQNTATLRSKSRRGQCCVIWGGKKHRGRDWGEKMEMDRHERMKRERKKEYN